MSPYNPQEKANNKVAISIIPRDKPNTMVTMSTTPRDNASYKLSKPIGPGGKLPRARFQSSRIYRADGKY